MIAFFKLRACLIFHKKIIIDAFRNKLGAFSPLNSPNEH